MYGGLDTHDAPCRLLCQLAECAVVSVDYRLAPEWRLPTAFDDSYAALEWVAENAHRFNGDAARIAVCGDSSGGTICATLAILSRDRSGPKIAYQSLLVPAIGVDMTTQSYTLRSNDFLNPELISYFIENMVADPASIDFAKNPDIHPYMRPCDAQSLEGLPPATVFVAKCDLLYDCGVDYAQRLKASGVPTLLIEGKGMIHQCTSIAHAIPSAMKHFEEICEPLRDALHA